jgi:hypothetical protein
MRTQAKEVEILSLQQLEKARPVLMDLERQRRELQKLHARKIMFSFGGLAVGVALIVLCVSVLNLINVKMAMFGILGAVVFTGIHLGNRRKPLEEKWRQTIGSTLLKVLHPDWNFSAGAHLPKQHFLPMGLVRKFNSIEGGNLIHGKHGETNFSFSYLRLNTDSNNQSSTVFEGMIVVADFHKEIKGKTIVWPDKASRDFGTWLGRKIKEFGRRGLDAVFLEDPVFERTFAVYSSDQIEARYILTPAMMNRLVELSRKYGNKLSFSFFRGKVCIAIKNLKPFDTSLNAPVSPEDLFYQFNRPIDQVTEIIDALHLNTRIWTKGED